MSNLETGSAVMLSLNALIQLANLNKYLSKELYVLIVYQWFTTFYGILSIVMYRRFEGTKRKMIIWGICQWTLIRFIVPLYDFEDRKTYMNNVEMALYII